MIAESIRASKGNGSVTQSFIDAAVAGKNGCTVGIIWTCWDTSINYVDYSTNRTPSVQKGRRSSQHFNTIDHQGINRNRVVFGLRGYAKGIGAVLQHANAEFIHSTNDGTVCGWTKGGLAYTGYVRQGVGNGKSLGIIELITGKSAPSLGHGFNRR
ncbi:MAG: hypothetical protein VYA10_03505 [Verrucomicrobiota bacterium]|nr:hypothetical protein [Verrucomicrobiota bacterium]